MLQRLYDVLAGKPSSARSSQWPKVRAAHLKKEPDCQVCGKRADVDVHHIVPVHVPIPDGGRSLELEPTNLITLCAVHHLWHGHLGRWDSWNLDVRLDAAQMREKIRNRPLAPKPSNPSGSTSSPLRSWWFGNG